MKPKFDISSFMIGIVIGLLTATLLSSCSTKVVVFVKDINQVHYTDTTIIIQGPAVIKPPVK